MNGVWGDDIELQAMSEVYDRPIEIYAYRAEPMRTFHEEQNGQGNLKEPIRLSYHGNEHYNSVIKYQKTPDDKRYIPLGFFEPGYLEERALMGSR